jgi:uncharacterized protein with beta-barrel porin domain
VAHLDRDGFSETGAGALQLDVRESEADYVDSLLGVRMAGVFQPGAFEMLPYLSMGWQRQISGGGPEVEASFNGYPDSLFTVLGTGIDADALRVQAGTSVEFGASWTGSFDYTLLWADNFQSHNVALDIGWHFGKDWTAKAGYSGVVGGSEEDLLMTVGLSTHF